MGKPGRPLPSKGKSGWLLEDTRQMEDKLVELRLRMEDEQRERQRRLDAGRVWASSHAPRPLVSKHQVAGRGNVTLDSSLRQAAASRVSALGSHVPNGSSHDRLSPGAPRYQKSPSHHEYRSDERASARQSHVTSTIAQLSISLAEGSFDEDDSRRSFLSALENWRGKSKRGSGMQAVDVASATYGCSSRSGIEHVAHGSASVFHRILLLKAAQKAGDAAASECQCHNARGESEPDQIPVPAPPAPLCMEFASDCKASCLDALPESEAECLHHCEEHPMKHFMEPSHLHEPWTGGMQDEEAMVLSVTDVNPYQVLTSRIRFPDEIILPY